MKKKSINFVIFSEKIDEKKIIIDELCKNLIFIDENIIKVKFNNKNKKLLLYLNNKISKKNKILLFVKIKKVLKHSYSKFTIPNPHIIFNKLNQTSSYNNNPMNIMIKNKEVFKENDGAYSFGNKLTKLINIFENKIIKIAKKLNANNFHFPSLISVDILDKVDYLKNNPHNIGFVTHLTEDLNKIEMFKKDILKKEKTININKKNFYKIKAMLSPTVCHHLYSMLSNTKLKQNLIATAQGHCFRYESKNMNFLDRLWNFTMREIIFVGSEKHVLKGLSITMKLIKEILDEFGLIYMIQSASDPFFGEMAGDKSLFQKAFKLKYEVRSKIPFNDTTIAIGSFNNSQDFFGKKLKITNKNGKPVHSGCIGFGNERFAYSFICQYGMNEKKWPSKILKLFKQ